jgi:hypothetical protein
VVVLGVACALFSLTYRLPKEGDPATFAKRTETRVWFAVAASTAAASLAAGVLLVRRWLELVNAVPWWAATFSVALPVIILAASRLPVFMLRILESPLPHHYRRTTPILALTGFGLVPAMSGMVLVAESSAGVALLNSAQAAPEAVETLVSRRDDLVHFLSAAAFVIIIAVVATAALRQALLAHKPGGNYPASALLLNGAFYSAFLSILFIPAYLALQRAGQGVVNVLTPVSSDNLLDHEWFVLRTDLATLLGLDVSLAGALGAAFALLTPAASSVLAAYLQAGGDRD